MSGSSFRSTSSSVTMLSPRFARRTRISGPASFEIERVHRLADFEIHVVGDVDDVADRPDACGVQPCGEPSRRRTDLHVRNGARVPGTQLLVVEMDREPVGAAAGQRRCLFPVAKRQAVGRGDFPRETDHAETVGSVRRDLEIDHGVAAVERLHRRNLESADAQFLGDVFGRRVEVDELAEPGQN